MEINLPPRLTDQIEKEIAAGAYASASEFLEEAVETLLELRERGQRRLESLRRIGHAVDESGLYENVLVPNRE